MFFDWQFKTSGRTEKSEAQIWYAATSDFTSNSASNDVQEFKS